MSYEEVQKARMKKALLRVNVMVKRMIFDPDWCVLDLYRVIVYPQDYNEFGEHNVNNSICQ